MQAQNLTITDDAAAGTWIELGLGGEFGAVTVQVPLELMDNMVY